MVEIKADMEWNNPSLTRLTGCYPEHFPAPSLGWTAMCDRRREVFGSDTLL